MVSATAQSEEKNAGSPACPPTSKARPHVKCKALDVKGFALYTQALLSRESEVLGNPTTKEGDPQGTPKAPQQCPPTTAPRPKTGQGATGLAALAAASSWPPRSRRTSEQNRLCRCAGKKRATKGAGRLKAESPGLGSGAATARTPQLFGLVTPPGSTPLSRESFFAPFTKNSF